MADLDFMVTGSQGGYSVDAYNCGEYLVVGLANLYFTRTIIHRQLDAVRQVRRCSLVCILNILTRESLVIRVTPSAPSTL
jgi:hypothetical protein